MAVELASAYLSLIPSLKGAGKQISSQLGGISMAPVASKMGASLSKGISSSLKANVKTAIFAPVNKALETQSSATRDLASAESALTKARASGQSAQARVVRAEEKLTALRDSGEASAGDLKVAEADLNTAKVALAETNVKVGNAEDALTSAKESATSANQAYVDSLKSTSTVSGRLSSALPAIGAHMVSVGTQWKDAGQKIGDVGKSLATKITAPAAAAATAVGGVVVGLGFKRLVGIDTARGQFKGLGYDADAVMKQVDKGVTGTALSMADGASMAVGILATGAVPMEKLEAQIQRTANVSAAYGVEGSHAANLLNAVLTKNKVTFGDLSQMQANGIPIISQLADHYGVAGDEIEKMAREGKISIEDMNKVIDKNAGAAAEEYSKTWAGVTANIRSNLGKLGADFLDGVFPQVKEQAEGLLDTLKSDAVRGFAKDMGEKLAGALSKVIDGVKSAVEWWGNLSPAMQKTIGTIGGIILVAGPAMMLVGKIVVTIGSLITAFGSIASAVGAAIPVIKALNVVMKANVIGIAITAIAALTAGLIWFFTQTDTGREIWGGFVNWLKDLWNGVSAFFSTLWETITTAFTTAWNAIVEFFVSSGNSISEWWTGLWTSIGEFFVAVWDAIVLGVQVALAAVGAFITVALTTIQTTWTNVWNGITAFLAAVWQRITNAVKLAIHNVKVTIANVVNAISAAWTNAWNAIKTFFSDLWTSIVDLVKRRVENIRTNVSNALNTIRNIWTNIWNGIKSFFIGLWTSIVDLVKRRIGNIQTNVSNTIEKIRGIWNSVWTSIKTFFSGIWENIVSAAKSYGDTVRQRFENVVNFVRDIPGKVIGFFSGLGSKLVESGKSLIGGFLDGITAGFRKAKQAVSDGLGKIRNLFPFSPAKEGPFSGRGWVAYSGLSIGETFSKSVADALHDGRSDIADEMASIQGELDSLDEPTFGVRTAVPAFASENGYGADGSTGVRPIVLQVENMTVDSDDRVNELAQGLWTRANRADRAQGKVDLGGVTVGV